MAKSLLHSLFRAVPNPVLAFDSDTLRILDVNSAACTLYGYSRDEFLYITLPDLDHPTLRLGSQSGAEGNLIHVHQTKAGEAIYVELHRFADDTDPSRITISMGINVTDRVTLEQERSELLERYQILSEAANDLLWDWDFRTNKITHNEALVTLYGYDRTHLQEDINWWAQLIHPDDYAISSWSIQEAIREKRRYWSAEYRFRKADGTYVPVLDRGILQTDENEKPVRMIGSIVDLTTRQAAEDEREQLFRLSLDSMLLLDRKGKISQANQAFHTLIGTSPEMTLRHNLHDFLSEQDAVILDEAIQRVLSNGEEGHFSTSVKTDSGSIRTIQWALISSEGKNRLFLTGRDITETILAQQELEEALARSQELAVAAQSANKAQTEFLQNMSHELRTPMNGLLGTAQLLAASASNEKQRHFSSILIKSGESLLQILNDILDFSKVESGEISLDAAPFVLPDIIQSVFDLFAVPAQHKGVILETSIAPNADVTLLGDQFRIRQVLSNLLGNAVKFTDIGEIHISLDLIFLNDHAVEAIIKVSDTGIGIDPSMQEKVFERFVQVDGSLTRKYGGTGLGLSITKTLVELMNGTIKVVSNTNAGTEFTVRIPFEVVKSGRSAKTLRTGHPMCSRPGTKVLIAEDVEVNALILASWLEDRGFACSTAATGGETMNLLQHEDFDGLFLDLNMPDFSGYEVIQMVRNREDRSGSHLPIVAVTASVSQEERQKCFSSGFDDYIPKPVMVSDLDRVISRLFETRA